MKEKVSRQVAVSDARQCLAMNTTTRTLAAALLATSSALAGAATTPLILAYADAQVKTSYTNLQAFHADIGALGLGSVYSLTAAGAITTNGMNPTAKKIISYAASIHLPLYPTVSDWDDGYQGGGFNPAVSQGILKTPAARDNAVAALVSLATTNGFAGIDIDLEAVQSADKSNYPLFLTALQSSLHAHGMQLIASVPPKTGDNAPSYLAGYDYAAMGAAVDWFQSMTYDEVGPGWCSTGFNGNVWPGPESGLDWQDAILRYTISRMPAAKVLSGLPSYGYDFSTGLVVYWADYGATLAKHSGAALKRDSKSATPYATWGTVKNEPDGKGWTKKTAQPTLWYDDAQSIQAKVGEVKTLGLGGTSVWAMGYEDAAFWAAVRTGLGLH